MCTFTIGRKLSSYNLSNIFSNGKETALPFTMYTVPIGFSMVL
jgi:hypothetical protein